MRGRDPDSGEFLAPSRSEQRREALAVFELAEQLVARTEAELAQLPIPEDLLDPIRHARSITAQIAHKRELQHLAKLMRREETETLDAIRLALDKDKSESRRETALLHHAETWRERLIAEGDEALTELLSEYPGIDRQHIRQVIRKAQRERQKNTPPHGQRELFRILRAAEPDAES